MFVFMLGREICISSKVIWQKTLNCFDFITKIGESLSQLTHPYFKYFAVHMVWTMKASIIYLSSIRKLPYSWKWKKSPYITGLSFLLNAPYHVNFRSSKHWNFVFPQKTLFFQYLVKIIALMKQNEITWLTKKPNWTNFRSKICQKA